MGQGSATQLLIAPVDGEAPREVVRDFTLGATSSGRRVIQRSNPSSPITVAGPSGCSPLARRQIGHRLGIPASFPIHRRRPRQHADSLPGQPFGDRAVLEAAIEGIQNLWRVTVDPRSLEWLNMERLTTGPGRDIAAALSADGSGWRTRLRASRRGSRAVAVSGRQNADRRGKRHHRARR